MPYSYLVNDHNHSYAPSRAEALDRWRRREGEGAVHGVVLASLNNLYKLDPSLFDSWMKILRRVREGKGGGGMKEVRG